MFVGSSSDLGKVFDDIRTSVVISAGKSANDASIKTQLMDPLNIFIVWPFPGMAGAWYEGFITGEGTELDTFPVGTRFIKPLIIANYDHKEATTYVDAFYIGEVTPLPDDSVTTPEKTTCLIRTDDGWVTL